MSIMHEIVGESGSADEPGCFAAVAAGVALLALLGVVWLVFL